MNLWRLGDTAVAVGLAAEQAHRDGSLSIRDSATFKDRYLSGIWPIEVGPQ